MNINLTRGILVLGMSQLLISCTGIGSWIQHSHCPVVPVSTANHLDGVELRARMHFSMESREAHFEVVARRVPEELVVVGIAQYGVRLFAVHQRGREIVVEGALSRESAHLARWTLDALHRAIWISTPSDAGAGPVVDWSWENESVTESIGGGQRRREFAHPGASDPVVIRYLSPSAEAGDRVEIQDHPSPFAEVGDRVEIQNPWCGYEARFVIVDTPERVVQ
jgi:hypothetical protein